MIIKLLGLKYQNLKFCDINMIHSLIYTRRKDTCYFTPIQCAGMLFSDAMTLCKLYNLAAKLQKYYYIYAVFDYLPFYCCLQQ